MGYSQQILPVTRQPHKPISGRKWTLVAFFLMVVSAIVNGNSAIPLIDQLIAGVLLAFAASVPPLAGELLLGVLVSDYPAIPG